MMSFPKIHHIGGHSLVEHVFDDVVQITEKIDGSQFTFGVIDGVLQLRSKGATMGVSKGTRAAHIGNVPKLFKPVVDYVTSIESRIPQNLFFYGETLCKPRHNTLEYARVPKNHFMLFAVSQKDQCTFIEDHSVIEQYAQILDVDVVPLLFQGKCKEEDIPGFVKGSVLGGCIAEGVVIKQFKYFEYYSKVMNILAVKYVTEQFREKHSKSTTYKQPKDRMDELIDSYRTVARWNKAVQHLRELDKLENCPKDIPTIMTEVRYDIIEEELENIKTELWVMFHKEFMSKVTKGLPEWYKTTLET